MCTVEDDGDLHPLASAKNNLLKKCVKCEEPGVLITRIHDSFCKNCFEVYVVHKFRAAIGKSHLIRDGERVLVAYSGGANSSAMLHLIQHGLSKRAHKKLRFIPTLIHVDESSVLDVPESERQQTLQKIANVMSQSEFPAYFTKIELGLTLERGKANSSMEDSNCLFWKPEELDFNVSDTLQKMSFNNSNNLLERLKSIKHGLASMSSQEDFFRNLRNQLLVCIARQMGVTKVLTAETSTRLGVRILTDVSQGRGAQLALSTGFADSRNGDILFVRPVRDLNSKDLSMFNNLFNVPSVFVPCLTTKGESGASIERLTEDFVTGLQADYQSTVPNIVRTSEKMGLPNMNADRCPFCQSPVDTNTGSASALKAVEFSMSLSQPQPGAALPNTESCDSSNSSACCGQGDGSCHTSSQSSTLSLDDLMEHLCYGCRLSLRNFKEDTGFLPQFVTRQAEVAKQRNKMRDEIADFLLDDQDDS